MNKNRIDTRISNKIVELAKIKTPGQLMQIVDKKISCINLLSIPGAKINSMIATDFGLMFKTEPGGKSLTLSGLCIDDKLSILEALKKP